MVQKHILDVILLGPPGVGKGTQAKLLANALGMAHVSTGDILRTEVKKKSVLGLQVQDIMDRGDLVSDEIVARLIETFLLDRFQSAVVFDGYPRTVSQAETLNLILEKVAKQSGMQRYLNVVSLTTSHKTIVERLSGRRTCEQCSKAFHISFSPPKVPGSCDFCGGRLLKRPDDDELTIQNRLDVYERQTEPLLEYYKAKNLLLTVPAELSPDIILANIIKVLA